MISVEASCMVGYFSANNCRYFKSKLLFISIFSINFLNSQALNPDKPWIFLTFSLLLIVPPTEYAGFRLPSFLKFRHFSLRYFDKVVEYKGSILGTRLMVGQQTLNLYVEVRILCPQPEWLIRSNLSGFLFSMSGLTLRIRTMNAGSCWYSGCVLPTKMTK